jgi:hypothetical protein
MRQKKAYSDGSIVALKRWMDEHPETVEPLQAEAEAASLDTLRLVRLALPNVPIYFLNPCSTITESDRRLCKAVGFVPVDGWWEYASQDPRYQVPNDGHWNLAGNTAAGQWLVRYFEAQGVFGP